MKRFHLAMLVVSLVCLMLTACGGSTSPSPTQKAAPTGPQKVNITIGDFYIHSPVTTFFTGTRYLLVVTNVGTHHHDLFIMHPMETMTMAMADVYRQALINIYNIAPNQTRGLMVIFHHTAPPGMLEFSCHYGGHYEAGMHQAIVVKAAPGASVSPYPNNGIPTHADSQPAGPCDPAITTTIADNAYTPASVSLKRGDTLTVTNIGKGTDILTTDPDAGIGFAGVDPNKTAYVTFMVAGTFTLSSEQHPEVKATIAVSKTAGTTCGMAPVATVSFDASYTNPANNRYFFIPAQMTIKKDQNIWLSNLTDLNLTFTSIPDADMGIVVVLKNQYRDLKFTTSGTYTISCAQFPDKKFTIVVQ